MPLFRPVRVKTLLLTVPLILFLLYFSYQRQQLPSLPSFVPNIHPTHNTSHAAEYSDDTSQSLYPEPDFPRPSTPDPTSSFTITRPVQEPNHGDPSPTKSRMKAASHSLSSLSSEPTFSKAMNIPTSKFNSSNTATSRPSNQTLIHAGNVTSQQQSISMANNPRMRKAQIKFWQALQPILAESRPNCNSPKKIKEAKIQPFRSSDGPLVRPKGLEMPGRDVEKMRKAHFRFMDAIGKGHLEMPFVPASRGLVSTAGGLYLPVFVISLRMLRQTGSTLPVEVFLADYEEYEEYICENTLPSLNATCIVLSDIFDEVPNSADIAKYQFKVFAMIFSSFENILFLDADAFPIHDPELLFSSELFQTHGLISWPDFWASSVSPFFYNITQQELPSMEDRASSEAGELLLSKKTHQRSLLLATYYNYYGPSHYYALLSQGAPGEGDKETFLSAASVLNESFYAVSESVQAVGHTKNDGGIDGSAMIQYDPIEDFNLTQHDLWRIKDPSVAKPPRPFFIHAHFPKFNPATILQPGSPAKDPKGNDRKVWIDIETTVKELGIGMEKKFWKEIKWTGCELEHKFRTWQNVEGICKNVTTYWNNIYEKPQRRVR